MPVSRAARFACTALLASLPAALGEPVKEKDKPYKSPYSVKFSHPLKELIGDIETGERGNPRDESSVPHAEWYSRHIREKFEAWGPPAKHYPAPAGLADRSVEWKRERTIAVALRFVGYGYQHHHIPDWDPPRDWPWKEVKAGHNGRGVDCSNFTAFVYNQGFGLKPTGNVKDQAELKEFTGPGETRKTAVEHIKLPGDYDKFTKTLKTGDLVYIRNRKEELAHVVLWVGAIGHAPDDTPLVLDSHGDDVKDSNGEQIPAGIRLRPFRKDSWYHKSASHALRVWYEK